MQLSPKLSKLSPALAEDLMELGKRLGMEITMDTSIAFLQLEDIKDEKTRKRAEKLLKKAEKEVNALAAGRLSDREVRRAPPPRPETLRRQALPSVKPEEPPLLSRPAMRVEESRRLLLEGNKKFVSESAAFRAAPEPVEYNCIVITCSDARCEMTRVEDYGSNILMLQVAGNVASQEVRDALSKLADGGEIIVCGHVDCGACKAKKQSPEAKDGLLGSVKIERKGTDDMFAANARNQADIIAALPEARARNAKVSTVLLDSRRLSFISGNPGGFVEQLQSSALRLAREDRAAGKDLSHQRAHALVISDPLDLGRFTNARKIFGAGKNEIFVVSAVNGKLDAQAIGSIEYALSHVEGLAETPHIVILHTSREVADETERVLRKKLGTKWLGMSIMQYDRASGQASLSF
jgi:carbonic anhydrase